MTLSDFATFSTAISGMAVTGSLIYLALQTHQNAKHTKALIHLERASRTITVMHAGLDPVVASAIIKASGGSATPDAVEKYIFRMYASLNFVGWQDTYIQNQSALLDDESVESLRRNIVGLMRHSGWRATWENEKRYEGSSFGDFVDGIIATLPSTGSTTL